ncbi:MAG: DMT family transporter [Lachnoclostridium sp.]|nr:DMT family transporter [Lachnospira sp.]MCM1247479.1 DMT family transporter [Lachnoclostridium sp.]
MNRKTTRNSFLLFTTAFIWGMAFVFQSKAMDFMHPLTFNGVRSLIGALSILAYLFISRRIFGQKPEPSDPQITIRAGILCGIAMTVASTLQQFGIQYTTVGKSGFITALYIIFVPIAGIFFHKKVSGIVWFAAFLAAVGMYLLCITESFRLGKGDILVFLCAIVFTAHIMLVDYYSPKADGVMISCIQFFICGILCSIGALIWGQPNLSQITEGMGTLLYAGVMSCGVAYTLQIIGQKNFNPTVAALILSLESVIATVAAWLFYKIGFLKTDQSMTPRQILGCIIVFTAILIVQLPSEWLHKK